MTTTTYTTRDEAIQREIVEPILAGVVGSIDEYDVPAIAAEVLDDYTHGYACRVDGAQFWAIVQKYAVPHDATYAVVASCSYRDEVCRYDILAASVAEAKAQAAERFAHEPTIGVDTDDVTVQFFGIVP